VYVDRQPREVTVAFRDMTPADSTTKARFQPGDIDTVLFVVDTTNTAPGTQGEFEIKDLRVEH
jgi:hypothetical protein